jgi:hypothetical protein
MDAWSGPVSRSCCRRACRSPRSAGAWAGTKRRWVLGQEARLTAVNGARHGARGGIARERLSELIGEGLSIAQIAERTRFSKGTVRYWLRRHGLQTHGAVERRRRAQARDASERGFESATMRCPHHGETEFVLDRRGSYRCRRCRAAAVVRRRRRMKKPSGCRGWRRMHDMRVFAHLACTAFPSRRPVKQAHRNQRSRVRAGTRAPPGRGTQVRAALRELPRGG